MYSNRLLILVSFLLFSFNGLFGQQIQKIELVSSDYLEGYKTPEGTIQKVYNGTFRHENTLLKSDSSFFNPKLNTFQAFGNVKITQGDSLHIYSDFLNYNGNTKKAVLNSRVKLVDKDATLTTDQLEYNTALRVATYETGGKLVNKNNTLTSMRGYYYVKTRDAYFKNSVEALSTEVKILSDTLRYNTQSRISFLYGPSKIYGKNDLLYTENGQYNTVNDVAKFGKNNTYSENGKILKGDSLFYDRKQGRGRAVKNIHFSDTVNKLELRGQLAWYYKQESAIWVTEKAYSNLEIQESKGKKDTIWFSADTIMSKEVKRIFKKDTIEKDSIAHIKTLKPIKRDSTYREMYAYRDVKTFKKDLQLRADSMAFSYSDSTLRFYKKPMLWSQGSQMNADSISMLIKNKKLHQMFLDANALIVSPEADSISFNQIRGRHMVGLFHENKLTKMIVSGNAESVYCAKDKDRTIGFNRSTCGKMSLAFGEGKLQNVTFIGKPDMKFMPLRKVTDDDKILNGFVWKPKSRPISKFDIIPINGNAISTTKTSYNSPMSLKKNNKRSRKKK